MSATKRLSKELKDLSKYNEFSCSPTSNILKWDIILYGPQDTIYEGGIFKATMEFKSDYPLKAPKFNFVSKITHPNIYKDGRVCISILHEGQDVYGYEDISERWNPQHGIASILLSILTMFHEPNFESPANVDASVMWQKNYNELKKIVYSEVAKTQK